MITSHEIFWGVVLPAILAVVAMLADARPWQRDREDGRGGWGAAIAVAGGLILAFIGRDLRPPFPPVEVEGWVFYFVGAAGIVGFLLAIFRAKILAAAAFALPFFGGITWLVLRPRVKYLQMSEGEMWNWVVGLMIAGGAWWWALENLATRVRGGTLPLLLGIFVGAAALVLVNAHSQRLGQHAGGISVALMAVSVVGFWGRGSSIARGAMMVLAVALIGLLLGGNFYAYLTRSELIWLAIAPLALWAGELPGIRNRPFSRFAASALAMLIVISIPLVPALKGLRETMKEQQQDPYQM